MWNLSLKTLKKSEKNITFLSRLSSSSLLGVAELEHWTADHFFSLLRQFSSFLLDHVQIYKTEDLIFVAKNGRGGCGLNLLSWIGILHFHQCLMVFVLSSPFTWHLGVFMVRFEQFGRFRLFSTRQIVYAVWH